MRCTEHQAATLEETAAALDEITATVNKTSEGASHGREAVAAAKTDAEEGGLVVGRAIEAMGQIESSAKQISQIIGVIDEIAFQTNLLALNAGSRPPALAKPAVALRSSPPRSGPWPSAPRTRPVRSRV